MCFQIKVSYDCKIDKNQLKTREQIVKRWAQNVISADIINDKITDDNIPFIVCAQQSQRLGMVLFLCFFVGDNHLSAKKFIILQA